MRGIFAAIRDLVKRESNLNLFNGLQGSIHLALILPVKGYVP
jgi:hypothetical protein